MLESIFSFHHIELQISLNSSIVVFSIKLAGKSTEKVWENETVQLISLCRIFVTFFVVSLKQLLIIDSHNHPSKIHNL